jgi:DNA-binding transcriptional LysR family regulator
MEEKPVLASCGRDRVGRNLLMIGRRASLPHRFLNVSPRAVAHHSYMSHLWCTLVAFSDRLVNLIEEGFDLAIRIGELKESSLIARRLTSAHMVVCAAPAYLRRVGRPETPSDLTRHTCLIYTETIWATTWRFEGPGGWRETIEVSGRVSSTNVEFIYQLALAGHGVVRLPSFHLGMDIAEGQRTELLWTGARTSRRSTWFIRTDRFCRPRSLRADSRMSAGAAVFEGPATD